METTIPTLSIIKDTDKQVGLFWMFILYIWTVEKRLLQMIRLWRECQASSSYFVQFVL